MTMKLWDHAIGATGIDLGVWAAPQSEPVVAAAERDALVVEFDCWLNAQEDPTRAATSAPYRARLAFTGVVAYRVMDGELPPYQLDFGDHDDPPCLFEVEPDGVDLAQRMCRDESWLPVARRSHDPQGWFDALDAWDPEQTPAPPRPAGVRHFIVEGDDTYVEVLAPRYAFSRTAMADCS